MNTPGYIVSPYLGGRGSSFGVFTATAAGCLLLTQALYSECRLMLLDATSMAQPLPSQQLHRYSGDDGRQATMFLSLDFEWWEKSHDYILEVGYSLWDNVTQRHRTRHWVIRENLNKVSAKQLLHPLTRVPL